MADSAPVSASDLMVPEAVLARRRRRYAADRRLQIYGLVAITLALGLLGILVATLVLSGYSAFTQTHVRVEFPIPEDLRRPGRPGGGQLPPGRAERGRRAVPRRAFRGRAAGDDRNPHQQHPVHRARRGRPRPVGDRRHAHARGPGVRSLRPAQQGPGRPRHARGAAPPGRPADRPLRPARGPGPGLAAVQHRPLSRTPTAASPRSPASGAPSSARSTCCWSAS